MKRRTVLTTVGVGVLSLGLFGGTAIAAERTATSPDSSTWRASADGTCCGTANGRGTGRGPAGLDTSSGPRGGQNTRNQGATGSGDCDETAYASGTLTDNQRADLVFMVQEEKLALDLYTALGAEYDIRTFTQIAGAEARHMDAVRTLLDTYGIDDPTIGLGAGEFIDPDLTSMYDTLLAQGTTSLDQALAVGRAVELDDIAALDEASDGVTAEDVVHVYAQLLARTDQHLAAFGG